MYSPIRRIVIVAALALVGIAASTAPTVGQEASVIGPGPYAVRGATLQASVIGPGPYAAYETQKSTSV